MFFQKHRAAVALRNAEIARHNAEREAEIAQHNAEREAEIAQHNVELEQARALAARLPNAEGAISIDGAAEFGEFVEEHNIDPTTILDEVRAVRIGLAQGGFFVDPGDSTLLLKKGERALFEAEADLLKVDRELQLADLRPAADAPIGIYMDTTDTGLLTITDQRVVYHGARKALEFPFTKLATLTVHPDAIDLGVTSRQSTSTFRLPDPELTAALIRAALNHRDSEVTVLRLEPETSKETRPSPASLTPNSTSDAPSARADGRDGTNGLLTGDVSVKAAISYASKPMEEGVEYAKRKDYDRPVLTSERGTMDTALSQPMRVTASPPPTGRFGQRTTACGRPGKSLASSS
jgi:multidrug efflux pump subunit AcrA (membrane-fusion protein)